MGRTWQRLLNEVVLSEHTGNTVRLAEARLGEDLEGLRRRLVDVLGVLDEVLDRAEKAEGSAPRAGGGDQAYRP